MYPFSKRFLLRFISLALKDPYGIRTVSLLDPALIPGDAQRLVVYALQQCARTSDGRITSIAADQAIWSRYCTGAFTRELCDEARQLLARAVETEPISRDEAKPVLVDALLHTGIGFALDTALRLYANRDYEKVESVVNDAFTKARSLEMTDLGFRLSTDLHRRLDRVRSGATRVERLPFGIPAVDTRLKGGLGRGCLGCILGQQKIGKSAALCWVAQTSILAGLNVVYVTVELSQDQVQSRIEAGLTGMLVDDIENGGDWIADQLAIELPKVVKGDYIVKWFPSRSLTIEALGMYLNDLKDSLDFKPDVLIVDYVDDMAMPKGEHYQAVGDLYAGIRALGHPDRHNCAVWTASQIKTSAIDHEYIRLWDAAESYLKGALIDLMLAICCTDDEAKAGAFRLYLVASRWAGGGKGVEDELGTYYTDYEHGRMFLHEGSRFTGSFTPVDRLGLAKLFDDISSERSVNETNGMMRLEFGKTAFDTILQQRKKDQ